jgi:hypothetical protein
MNEAFRMLFDQVKSGVVWVARDGNVRYANKAAVQLTPCLLGRPFMDPMVNRSIKSAVEGLLQLPFQFEITTQEEKPDVVRAVIIPAPVGTDLMLVLNNVSEERWYTQALENLIRYVEAEMAQPIERLVADLASLQVPEAGPRGGKDERLTQDAHELSGKLGKLRDLVQVFGSGAIRRDDRIVMSELIREALASVAPLLDERNITVTLNGTEGELTIYGSPAWLARAMVEFLEHVIRAAARASVIEVSVAGNGTRILLRSRNRGLFVSNHDRRNAFVPFGVGDGPAQARQRIGMALARYIVEQHGGTVRIEDEFDAVDFVMELPAGAPAAQDAQLSVEQAQRYARDMAQLMARGGKRSAGRPA